MKKRRRLPPPPWLTGPGQYRPGIKFRGGGGQVESWWNKLMTGGAEPRGG